MPPNHDVVYLLRLAAELTLNPPECGSLLLMWGEPVFDRVALELLTSLMNAGYPTPATLLTELIDGRDSADRVHEMIRRTIPDADRAIAQYDALWAWGHARLQYMCDIARPRVVGARWVRRDGGTGNDAAHGPGRLWLPPTRMHYARPVSAPSHADESRG
jgi:hypothetical protein